jgi:hypothetical protein
MALLSHAGNGSTEATLLQHDVDAKPVLALSDCQSGLRHFHLDYYKSSPLWFVVGGTKAPVRSSRMNTGIHVVRATGA